MAARINKKHQDSVRLRIQVSQLINRLQGCAMGKVEMTPAQMKAAEVLLKKALPDLSQVEQHNTGDTKTYLVQTPLEAKDPESWEQAAARITDEKKNAH
jgi:hypothetical protein